MQLGIFIILRPTLVIDHNLLLLTIIIIIIIIYFDNRIHSIIIFYTVCHDRCNKKLQIIQNNNKTQTKTLRVNVISVHDMQTQLTHIHTKSMSPANI